MDGLQEKQSSSNEQPRGVTRRTVLKAGLATLGLTALGVGGKLAYDKLTEQERIEAKSGFIKLGRENEHSLAQYGIKWTPDGHLPYQDLPQQRRLYVVSGNAAAYGIVGSPNKTFGQLVDSGQLRPEMVSSPDRSVEYKNGYQAITSLLRTDSKNPNHLFALTHNEQWQSRWNGGNFTATVGLLESLDGGQSWKDHGPIIAGQDSKSPGDERVSGAGQPCGIVKGGEIWIYYIEWASQRLLQHPDQLYLTKAEIGKNGMPQALSYLTGTGFTEKPTLGSLTPVIIPPENIEDTQYAALPSVSFNRYLNCFLCVFETNVGFCVTKSADGIRWEPGQLILQFPQPHSERRSGDIWYSYPTLLSDQDQPNDQITGKTGNLYCSKGVWGKSHQLVSLPFEIS